MARHWTKAERERQATLINQWKPWQYSTGPRTRQGKKCSALNAQKSITAQDIVRLNGLLVYSEGAHKFR